MNNNSPNSELLADHIEFSYYVFPRQNICTAQINHMTVAYLLLPSQITALFYINHDFSII